jgi:hypothetical protein
MRTTRDILLLSGLMASCIVLDEYYEHTLGLYIDQIKPKEECLYKEFYLAKNQYQRNKRNRGLK